MPEQKSRVADVAALLDLMVARGVSTLKVGDIELTLAPPAPVEDEKPRFISKDEAESNARLARRNMMLAAGSRVVSRAGE